MSIDEPADIIPVILSGGAGTRLWPISTRARPKQLLPLLTENSMLQETAARVTGSAYAQPLVVCSAAHADEIESQLSGVGPTLLLEPCARNTAPALALAALVAPPEALLLVLPSDHRIDDVEGFNVAVARAAPLASQGWILTFGMRPDRPETGYGYIERGEEIADGIFRAAAFVEKPDQERARSYLDSGRFDWNGGIFLFQVGRLLQELERQAKELLGSVRESVEQGNWDGQRFHPASAPFAAAPSISIDYAVMEEAEQVAVQPVSIGWSDVGSWEALHEVAAKDEDGNALADNAAAIDARGCLVRSTGPSVSIVGVDDLVVIATPDNVLVIPRAQSQRVKEIVEALDAQPPAPAPR